MPFHLALPSSLFSIGPLPRKRKSASIPLAISSRISGPFCSVRAPLKSTIFLSWGSLSFFLSFIFPSLGSSERSIQSYTTSSLSLETPSPCASFAR